MRTVRRSGGGCLPEAETPPPMDRMTDACENITFPQQLLRTVNINILGKLKC